MGARVRWLVVALLPAALTGSARADVGPPSRIAYARVSGSAAKKDNDRDFAAWRAFDGKRRNLARNSGNFRGARIDHVLMVCRLVVHVSGDVFLFQAADSVHQAGCAGDGPRPGQGGFIP